MENKVTFPKNTRANFKALFVFTCLSLLFSKEVLAWPFASEFMPTGYSLVDGFPLTESAPPFYSDRPNDCSRNAGVVFNFSASMNFRLSGISLYFQNDLRTVPESVYRPADLAISLFEGDRVDPEKTVVFRVPFRNTSSSHNKALSLQLIEPRGLLFELGPVWLEKNKTYTVLLECSNSSPPQHVIGEGNAVNISNFDSETFTAEVFAKPADGLKKPYFRLYSKNDGLTFVKPSDKLVPASRPVIFVHGLGGFPSDFADYLELLKGQGWDSRYLLSFDFGLKNGDYNNYADLDELLGRINLAVATISAAYKTDGGDGKVNLVGYSSGALLAKNYLGSRKDSPRVKNFISIAGLFKGSFLADLESSNSAFPRAAGEVTTGLAKLFLPSLSSFYPLTLGRAPKDSLFGTRLVSTNAKVIAHKKEDLPSGINYYNLQGDIKAASTQKLFKSLVKSEGSLGDGAVLGSSTSDLPNVSAFSFLDSAVATRSVTRSNATVSAGFTLPDFSKIKFFHSNLLKAVEIKNKILELLK